MTTNRSSNPAKYVRCLPLGMETIHPLELNRQMEFKKKFGNIDLYLFQLRGAVAREMAFHCSANSFLLYDEEYYRTYAVKKMTGFLMKRLSRRVDVYKPHLDKDTLCNTLYQRDISFTSSSEWHGDEKMTNVCFDGLMIYFNCSERQRYPVKFVYRPFRPGCTIYKNKGNISPDDAIDLMLMVDSLHDRIAAIEHEEYTARVSKMKANRIRRIAAKCRRECKE